MVCGGVYRIDSDGVCSQLCEERDVTSAGIPVSQGIAVLNAATGRAIAGKFL